jgi:type IV pilus assembly protein PilA
VVLDHAFGAARAREHERGRGEAGFSLIELMVVVLTIAILIGIAIPTFVGARSKAQDRDAQANLRTGLTTIKAAYTDSQSYVAAATELATAEPTLSFATGAGASSHGQREIAVDAVDDQDVGMAALASDGVCWQLFDAAEGAGTTYGSQSGSTAATCTPPGSPLEATSW